MMHLSELKREFRLLKSFAKHKRMLELCALLTDYLQGIGIKPVVVGGLSVEIYTKNNYTTFDIDLVSDGREMFGQLLVEELGFKEVGRNWYHEQLEISIEIPSNYLDGSQERVIELLLESGRKIFVIGIEDVIIHRLESAVVSHRDNPEWSDDFDWAKRMFEIHKNDREMVDLHYLQLASEDKDVQTIIKSWIDKND